MPQTTFIEVRQEWQEAWLVTAFRRRVMTGLVILAAMLSILPRFFQAIERRHGIVLNDPVLRMLPPHNVSMPLFIVIWAFSAYCIYRAAQMPRMFLTFLWSFIFLCAFRMLTITLVPLDPPAGLIGLVDPLSNFFYGGDKFVTKDLFFSGHTSAVFLLYLTVPGKTDKKLGLVVTAVVGFLLLVQHVHYTLDVLGGLVFCWLSYQIATRTVLR
ncbi:MAG TPA: phosphatase PAP2-related protein [Puia sp.]|nr:phosphatase PAP2-related protein [Puia sp.]